MSPERLFDELDTNKDGQISKDEFLKRHTAMGVPRGPESHRPEAPRHDPRGFGRPGFGPFPGMPGPFGPPSVDMIFGRADHNKDGKLTKDEVPAFMWDRLSQADTDKDGAVSKSELEAHIKQRMSGRKPDGHKPDGQKPDDQKPDDQKPDGKKPNSDQKTDASDEPAVEQPSVIST